MDRVTTFAEATARQERLAPHATSNGSASRESGASLERERGKWLAFVENAGKGLNVYEEGILYELHKTVGNPGGVCRRNVIYFRANKDRWRR
jgi:hypothetical protein